MGRVSQHPCVITSHSHPISTICCKISFYKFEADQFRLTANVCGGIRKIGENWRAAIGCRCSLSCRIIQTRLQNTCHKLAEGPIIPHLSKFLSCQNSSAVEFLKLPCDYLAAMTPQLFSSSAKLIPQLSCFLSCNVFSAVKVPQL